MSCYDINGRGLSSSVYVHSPHVASYRGEHSPGIHWLATWVDARASADDVEGGQIDYRAEISGSDLAIYRKGELWWSCRTSGCGISSQERLLLLDEKI